MDQYMTQIEKIIRERKTSLRVRFMLKDVVDLRQRNWVRKVFKSQGAKTIEQIHADFKKEKEQQALQVSAAATYTMNSQLRGGRLGAHLKKINIIVKKYLANTEETSKCLDELKMPSYSSHLIVTASLEASLEKSTSDRCNIAQLLSHLVKNNKITPEQYIKGVMNIMDLAVDIELDLPKVWSCLAELVAPIFYTSGSKISFSCLKAISEPLLELEKAAVFVAEILKILTQHMSVDTAVQYWKESGLGMNHFLKSDDPSIISEFLDRHDLSSFFDANSQITVSKEIPPTSYQTYLLEIKKQLNMNMSDDDFFDWVESKFSKDEISQPNFIRSLTSAVCQKAIIEGDKQLEVDKSIIQTHSVLLKKYIDTAAKELQAVYALQQLFADLEQPPNVLKLLFDFLYDEDIISEQTFFDWEVAEDPECEGKGVALLSVNPFFTWLREADVESEKTLEAERKREEEVRSCVKIYKDSMEKWLKISYVSDIKLRVRHQKTKEEVIKKLIEKSKKNINQPSNLNLVEEKVKFWIEAEYDNIKQKQLILKAEKERDDKVRLYLQTYKDSMEKSLKNAYLSDFELCILHKKTTEEVVGEMIEQLKDDLNTGELDFLVDKLRFLINMEYDRIKTLEQKQLASYFFPDEVKCVVGDGGFLGKGGFGCVRLGYLEVLVYVAVKCIAVTGSKQEIETTQQKFTKEIQLLQKASHPNVVRVEGYTTWQGAVGMIMEYMPGGSLSSLLFSEKDDVYEIPFIHPTIRLRFCYYITQGMTFLHHGSNDQRMTHGDLKPHNILLTYDLRCKIADFGGADFSTCTETTTDEMSAHRQEYTRAYAAPERLSSPESKQTKKMDVYSVGMIFQGILVRNPPPLDQRRESDEVENIKKTYEGQSNDQIIDLIQTEMKRSRNESPQSRPSMKEIRDEFSDLYFKIDTNSMLGHVCSITKHMKEKLSAPSKASLKPINHFVSPGFQN